jgi:hypothetical protein
MSRLTKIAPKVGTTDFLLVAAKAALAEAREKHPQPFVDYNHLMGVLDEEFTEVKTEAYRKRVRTEAIQSELLQVIAVCLRGLEDLTLKPQPNQKVKP